MVKKEVTRNRIKAGMEIFIHRKCFDKIIKAVIMTETIPDFVIGDGVKLNRKGNFWEFTKQNGEHVRKGEIGKAFWCEYSAGEIDVLPCSEQSDYILMLNGKDAGPLNEFL